MNFIHYFSQAFRSLAPCKAIFLSFFFAIVPSILCYAESEEFGFYTIEMNPRRPVIKLSDMGFSGPVVARGKNPQIAFKIKQYPGMKNQIRTHLYLTLSPNLTSDSRLTVYLNGAEIYTSDLTEYGRRIEIPLEINVKSGTPIDIQISGNLNTNDKQIIPWMMLLPDSQVQYELAPDELPIFSDFILRNQSFVPIVLAENTQKNMQAALRMASVIGSLYIPWKLTSKLVKDSEVRSPFKIVIGSFKDDLSIWEKTINLAPEGVDLFLQPPQNWIAIIKSQSKVNVPHLSVLETSAEPPRIFPFNTLEFPSQMLQGMGDLTTAIPFKLADFGQDCSQIRCYIVISTTGVSEDLITFLAAKINGQLIQSIKVQPAAERDVYTFTIPGPLIESENFLELTLMCYPANDQSNAVSNSQTISLTIHPDSYLKVYPGKSDQRLMLSDFPGRFVGKGLFRFSSLDQQICRLGFEAGQKIGRQQGRPSNITLRINENAQNFDQKYLVALLSPKETNAYSLPLQLAETFYLFQPKTGNVFLEANKEHAFAIMETVRIKTCPALIISDMQLPMFEGINLPNTEEFRKMTTQVAFNIQSTWSPIILNTEMRVYYEDPRSFNQFWNKYKGIVVTLLSILSALFIYFTYTRLTKGEFS